MLDIVFISYDEPNSEQHWSALKDRWPHAQRVHGVRGIAAAHHAASALAHTKFFYVVDGDAQILDDFDFSYKPDAYESDYVLIWAAQNPALGISYGYGGVKLFNKKFFNNHTDQLDFSTTLASGIKIMPEVAAITHFNSDPQRAWRGAFREVVKLALTVQDNRRPEQERLEAEQRLGAWSNPLPSAKYRRFIVDGVRAARLAVQEHGEHGLKFINDHDYMVQLMKSSYPELDWELDPWSTVSGANEFKFTTRIASALYDSAVLNNLKIEELRDALSDGQLLSKYWLVGELDKILGACARSSRTKVAIAGGWIGTLALLMHVQGLHVATTIIDLDSRACKIAEKLNWGLPSGTLVADMYAVDWKEWDVIINTSSEHIPDISAWCRQIPTGKIVVLQNNTATDIDGHVSCVRSSCELREHSGFKNIIYEGTRRFAQYDRFMIIART